MDRRGFLKFLGAGLAVAAAPKLIFDMGANLWRYDPVERIDLRFSSAAEEILYNYNWALKHGYYITTGEVALVPRYDAIYSEVHVRPSLT